MSCVSRLRKIFSRRKNKVTFFGPTKKVLLVGDAGSGKTAFLHKHSYKDSNLYTSGPTLGIEVSPIDWKGENGPLRFNVWDCAGEEKFKGLEDGYFVEADAAIIFQKKEDSIGARRYADIFIKQFGED